MRTVKLYPHQQQALNRMKDGCVLCGGVGTGKSITALSYFFSRGEGKPLIIITTARKRDMKEWEKELAHFDFFAIIDSWNNLHKYEDITGSFFIFDEQRVCGSGAWVKSFLRVAKNNRWILLSATPGDTWIDYIPVFLANHFFKNRTQFMREHVVLNRFTKYPKVDRYLNERRLERMRDDILVTMTDERKTEKQFNDVKCQYPEMLYGKIVTERFDPWEEKPIEGAAQLCYLLRKAVNIDPSRVRTVRHILGEHPKAIIFYNFDYELEALRELKDLTTVAEWNGHKHEPIPVKKESWVYLVQYSAGAEGWNCIDTDTIIFFSRSYSYKTMTQAAGRIDRLNTPFPILYYYSLISDAPIDKSIGQALKRKRNFNEKAWAEELNLT